MANNKRKTKPSRRCIVLNEKLLEIAQEIATHVGNICKIAYNDAGEEKKITTTKTFKNHIYLLPRQTGKTSIACSAVIARALSQSNERIVYFVSRYSCLDYVKEKILENLNQISKVKTCNVSLYKSYTSSTITLYNDSVIYFCVAGQAANLFKGQDKPFITHVIIDDTVEYQPNQTEWHLCDVVQSISAITDDGEVSGMSIPPIDILISKNFYAEVDKKTNSIQSYLDFNYHNPMKNDKHCFVHYPANEWNVVNYNKVEMGMIKAEDYDNWKKLAILEALEGDEEAFKRECEPSVIELPLNFDTPLKRMNDIFDFFTERVEDVR